MLSWHIITGEYPPDIGGVSSYSRLVAEGLASAGDDVHVWCPGLPEATGNNGVTVHHDLGQLSRRDLRAVDRLLDRFLSPRRLLVQWVPQGFGYRSMNVGFCLWLWRRARRGDQVDIMVHEPYLAFGEGAFRWTAAAFVHRIMTVILARAARRIWVAIPAWERRWRPYTFGRDVPFAWLPVPSSLPVPAGEGVTRVRDRYAPRGGQVVGHLSSYGTAAARMLSAIVPAILRRSPSCAALLLGRNGERLFQQLAADHPALSARMHVSGALSPDSLAEHVAACDLLIQPYPDGISSRRTSAMAGLALGIPLVTTRGPLTESLWSETHCVSLADVSDSDTLVAEALRLLSDDGERSAVGSRGRDVYLRLFELSHTIGALRRDAQRPCESPS